MKFPHLKSCQRKNKSFVRLSGMFLVQLLASMGINQSVIAQSPLQPLCACWTLGATNPKGNDQNEKWADAQWQLREGFRRDPSLRRHRVTGYCKGHTKGFKLRTTENASNVNPGTNSSNLPTLGPRGFGACWTRGATNPKGNNESERWADAQSQLHSHFRRNQRLEAIKVTGYCVDHTKGFKWRTPEIRRLFHPDDIKRLEEEHRNRCTFVMQMNGEC